MQKSPWYVWIGIAVIGLLAGLYFWNLAAVPFHPDEATHIYMSKDLARLFRQPGSLAWQGELPLSSEERIRAIDAPLTKYLIGTARGLSSTPALEADWDWSESWLENASAGALPSRDQLWISRAAVTASLLAGLWFYYLALRAHFPPPLCILGTLLLGLNPLITLHGRRAMSEGALIFGVGFFLWAATRENRNPWLIGLALGLAINAKHTAAALLPAGLFAASLIRDHQKDWKRILFRISQFAAAGALVATALNPFYWRQPLPALRVGLEARGTLARLQKADYSEQLGLEGASPVTKSAALLANAYFTKPQTEEVGNYLAETGPSRANYLANPLSSWGRGWIAGGIFLILSMTGFTLTVLQLGRRPTSRQENSLIWLLSSLGAFLILLFPLPWQRYILLLLPFSTYWALAGILPLYRQITEPAAGKNSSPTAT